MNGMTPGDEEAPRKPRSRAKWPLLAGGCCLLIVLACGGFCGGLLAVVHGSFTRSEAYTRALAIARGDPDVTQAFGGSFEPGVMVMGSVSVENDSGHADITIPIKGPGGSGSIHVIATKAGGAWTIDSLLVTKKDTGKVWDLTPPR